MSTNDVPLLRAGLAERLFLTLNLGNLTIYGPAIKAIADERAVVVPAAELAALRQRLAEAEPCLAFLKRLIPYIDSIICYASTVDEYEGNELAKLGNEIGLQIDAAMEKRS